eukprot:5409632-Alexandrium_andersonii.AAC.1
MVYDGHEVSRHNLSERLFSSAPGSLRADLLRFLGGAELSSLSRLHKLAAELAMVVVLESSVEGKHAQIARGIEHASNVSPPY